MKNGTVRRSTFSYVNSQGTDRHTEYGEACCRAIDDVAFSLVRCKGAKCLNRCATDASCVGQVLTQLARLIMARVGI